MTEYEVRARLSTLLGLLWTQFRVFCKPARTVNITRRGEIKNIKISLRNHRSFQTSVEYAVSFFLLLLLRPCFIEYKHDKCWNGASWEKKVSSYVSSGRFRKKWVNSRISKLFITYRIKYNPYTYCICDISLSVFFENILNNWVNESKRGLRHNNPKTLFFFLISALCCHLWNKANWHVEMKMSTCAWVTLIFCVC